MADLPEALQQDDPELCADDIGWSGRKVGQPAACQMVIVGQYRHDDFEDKMRAMLQRWAELIGGEFSWTDWLAQGTVEATLPGDVRVSITGNAHTADA